MLSKNFSFITILSNLLFYIGIIFTLCLCNTEENTPLFLIGYLCIIIGWIGTALTDSVINAGTEGISIPIFQMTLIIKEAILIMLFVVLHKYFHVALYIMLGLAVADNILEAILTKQINETQLSIKDFLLQEAPADWKLLSKVRRGYWINIIFVFLFYNVHENMYETVITLIIALVGHVITLKKTVTSICDYTGLQEKSLNRMKVVLWFIELMVLVMAYLGVDMILLCSVLGYYYMIITDCANPQRTSVIKVKRGN